MARKRTTGARFNLGEQLDNDLNDFCAAHFDTSATAVIREALVFYLQEKLKVPETKHRFYQARKVRLGLRNNEKISVLRPTSK